MPQQRQDAACRAPERRVLLTYALERCEEEEALAFEAHLLGCEVCFEDLKCLDRAGRLLLELTEDPTPLRERLLRALQAPPPAAGRPSGSRSAAVPVAPAEPTGGGPAGRPGPR